jgi:hypothetical protein
MASIRDPRFAVVAPRPVRPSPDIVIESGQRWT